MRHRQPRIVGLVAVGVLSLLAGGLFAYVTVRDTRDTTAHPSPAAEETGRFVSADGRFEVAVPAGLQAKRIGNGARFSSPDKDLVVSVGPISAGPIRAATGTFLDTLRHAYPAVRVLGTKPERVDGRAGLSTFGQATNAGKVPLRFVLVTVPGRPRNYAITAFTARDSDPRAVLPKVDAIVNGFHVRATR